MVDRRATISMLDPARPPAFSQKKLLDGFSGVYTANQLFATEKGML
jgi:hypothetical protein